jgi:hypothetical protein
MWVIKVQSIIKVTKFTFRDSSKILGCASVAVAGRSRLAALLCRRRLVRRGFMVRDDGPPSDTDSVTSQSSEVMLLEMDSGI